MTSSILHMITFTWKAGTTPAQVDAFHTRILEFAGRSKGVQMFIAGPDAGLMAENAAYGIVAKFESPEAFEAYRSAPEHLQIIDETLMPILDGRSRMQILPQPGPAESRPSETR